MEHSGLNKEVPYDDLLLRKAFGESVQPVGGINLAHT